MTMRETWLRFVSACCRPEPGPTLDERIAKQVASLAWNADCNHKLVVNRLTGLEAHVDGLRKRSENVDAFYVKTITQALSERQDALVNKVWNQWADDSKAMSTRMDKLTLEVSERHRLLSEQITTINGELGTLHSRLSSLVSKLRAGLE